MGPVFLIEPILTVAGPLRLLKIRKPDSKRPEIGDADFTLDNCDQIKEKLLEKKNCQLITREKFEMLELKDPNFDVLVYFSCPTLLEVLKITTSSHPTP